MGNINQNWGIWDVSDFNALLQELDGAGDKKNTYKARIHALQTSGQDTSRIEKGILDVKAVLNSGTRRFVIYGEPQSGKTEFMIALTCHLVDSGFRTIFVVMNDNTELEEQNYPEQSIAIDSAPVVIAKQM